MITQREKNPPKKLISHTPDWDRVSIARHIIVTLFLGISWWTHLEIDDRDSCDLPAVVEISSPPWRVVVDEKTRKKKNVLSRTISVLYTNRDFAIDSQEILDDQVACFQQLLE